MGMGVEEKGVPGEGNSICEGPEHLPCAPPIGCQVRRWKRSPSRITSFSKTRAVFIHLCIPSAQLIVGHMSELTGISGLGNSKRRCPVTGERDRAGKRLHLFLAAPSLVPWQMCQENGPCPSHKP